MNCITSNANRLPEWCSVSSMRCARNQRADHGRTAQRSESFQLSSAGPRVTSAILLDGSRQAQMLEIRVNITSNDHVSLAHATRVLAQSTSAMTASSWAGAAHRTCALHVHMIT
jgi:hypothetical protein